MEIAPYLTASTGHHHVKHILFLFNCADRLHSNSLPLQYQIKNSAIMGLLDFLLFGAFMNSLRNNQNSNNHSDYSNKRYNQGYEDGYTDGYEDHDEYHCHDDYDFSDNCDCDYDNDFDL